MKILEQTTTKLTIKRNDFLSGFYLINSYDNESDKLVFFVSLLGFN